MCESDILQKNSLKVFLPRLPGFFMIMVLQFLLVTKPQVLNPDLWA